MHAAFLCLDFIDNLGSVILTVKKHKKARLSRASIKGMDGLDYKYL